jgi:hypothetical protein
MKQIFLFLTGIAIFMSSCTKEDSVSIPVTSSPAPGQTAYTLNLNANHWTKDGIFICTFTDILNYANANKVTVFLEHDGLETEITRSGIQYMNGLLKSLINGKDVSLTYDPEDNNNELPFSSLNIKLVFQQ